MNSFLYDLKRSFTGKFTIFSILFIALISWAATYLFSANSVVVESTTGIGVANAAYTIYSSLVSELVTLLAVMSSYFYYGKDKANGVLESIICRPVTKGRLVLSRYLANVSSLIVAFVIGAGIFEYFLYRNAGVYLTTYYFAALIWMYLVEIAALTGVIYLATQFLRTQGAILGVALLVFFVFGLFWTDIVYVISLYALHFTSGSSAYNMTLIIMHAVSPAGYSSVIGYYLIPLSLSHNFNPSQYGLTLTSVMSLGISWLIVPIALAFVLGRKKD